MPTEWLLTITAEAEVVHPDGTTDADDPPTPDVKEIQP